MLYHFQYVGIIYMVVALAMGLYWVYLVAKGFRAQDDESWSKKVFFFSLFYLTFLVLVIVLDTDGALSNLIGL
jgi:protoheme IX farnesyltransferase